MSSVRDKFAEAAELQKYLDFFRNYRGNDPRVLRARKRFQEARVRGLFDALDEPISKGRRFRKFDAAD